MKRGLVIGLVVVVLISVVSIFIYYNSLNSSLPNNFSIHLYADGTSSGGSRYYHTYITFEGDKITSIKKMQNFGQGVGV